MDDDQFFISVEETRAVMEEVYKGVTSGSTLGKKEEGAPEREMPRTDTAPHTPKSIRKYGNPNMKPSLLIRIRATFLYIITLKFIRRS